MYLLWKRRRVSLAICSILLKMSRLEKGGYHEKNPAVGSAEQIIAHHQARH